MKRKNNKVPTIKQKFIKKICIYYPKFYSIKNKKNRIGFCRFGISSLYRQNKVNILKYNKLFSSTTDSNLNSSNETKLEKMSLKELQITLKDITVVNLKKLAKDYKMNLCKQRKKAQIILLIIDYFSKLKKTSLKNNFEVLENENSEQKSLIISNNFINQREDNFMNISAIFRLDKKKDIPSGDLVKQQKTFYLI